MIFVTNRKFAIVEVKEDISIDNISLNKGMSISILVESDLSDVFLVKVLSNHILKKKSYELTKKYKKQIIEGFKQKYKIDISKKWEIYRAFFIVKVSNFPLICP